jgi:hypothetical protein
MTRAALGRRLLLRLTSIRRQYYLMREVTQQRVFLRELFPLTLWCPILGTSLMGILVALQPGAFCPVDRFKIP